LYRLRIYVVKDFYINEGLTAGEKELNDSLKVILNYATCFRDIC